ncbi:MAG: hemolysin, partial [Halothiobacillaceae bacterium]
ADGGAEAKAIMAQLRGRYLTPDDLRVVPHRALPEQLPARDGRPRVPPLLKAYMRLGAQICGEPCLDPVFGTADVFVLLDCDRLHRRYHRHFIARGGEPRANTRDREALAAA